MQWGRSPEHFHRDLEDVSRILPSRKRKSWVPTLAWNWALGGGRPSLPVYVSCVRHPIAVVPKFEFPSTMCATFLMRGSGLRTNTAPPARRNTRRWRTNVLSFQATAASGSSFGRSRKWRRDILCPPGRHVATCVDIGPHILNAGLRFASWTSHGFFGSASSFSIRKKNAYGFVKNISQETRYHLSFGDTGMPRIYATFGTTFTDWAFVRHSHAEQPQRWWLSFYDDMTVDHEPLPAGRYHL